MIAHKAGDTVHYRVTWLEMAQRPTYGWPAQPAGHEAALLKADTPPWWWFLALYDAVGRDYAWTDKHRYGPEALNTWIQSPDVEIWTLMGKGWPQGFFMLDWSDAGICDLSYFGLVPEAVGTGLGTFLLRTAVLTGWARGAEDGRQHLHAGPPPRAGAVSTRGFCPRADRGTFARPAARSGVPATPPVRTDPRCSPPCKRQSPIRS